MTCPRPDPVVVRSAVLSVFTVLLLSACRTEEIYPSHAIFSFSPTDSSQGGLLVIVAPTAETAAEEDADPQEPTYHLVVDGQELMWDGLPANQPLVLGPAEPTVAGFYAAGQHHFELAATDSPAVFGFDGVIAGNGALNRLYVFGPRGGIQARFVSYPNGVPAGKQHLSVINLVRAGGVQIEVVSCTDPATCTPVSPPLALGDTFDADFPIVPTSGNSLSESGAGYGYRQVAPALPTPPINPLEDGFEIFSPVGGSLDAYVGAPIYMSSDGTPLDESN